MKKVATKLPQRRFAATLLVALVVLTTGASLLSTPASAQAAHSSIGNDVISGAPNCAIGPCWRPYVGAPPGGYQQFTVVASTALPSIPTGAAEALVICETQTVRWRDDGVAPTASVGMPLTANTAFPYTGNLAAVRIIQTTATATCNVSYYY